MEWNLQSLQLKLCLFLCLDRKGYAQCTVQVGVVCVATDVVGFCHLALLRKPAVVRRMWADILYYSMACVCIFGCDRP